MSLPIITTDVVDGDSLSHEQIVSQMWASDYRSFANDVEAVSALPYGPGGHISAVELMARKLRELGFGAGVDALERRGLLREPERSCQMAFATGEVCP